MCVPMCEYSRLCVCVCALEKEMATHSSVLAWRIPGMGKPGGLPSMGSHSRRDLPGKGDPVGTPGGCLLVPVQGPSLSLLCVS